MTSLDSPPRPFVRIEARVIRFLGIAMVAMVGLLLLVSYKQGLFIAHVPLQFDTADASGIVRGMAVKLFGMQIGSVKDMAIQDDKVRVWLSVGAEQLPHIARGSQVRLVRDSFVGGAALHLVPPHALASGPGAPIAANEVLTYVPTDTVADTLDELRTEVKPLVSDLRALLKDFSGPDGEYRRYTAAARELLGEIRESNRQAHLLLRNADRAMLAAEGTFSSMSRASAQAERQIPIVTGKLGATIDSFGMAAAELREAAKKNSDALHETLRLTPALIVDADRLVRQGSEMVRGANALVQESEGMVRDGREMLGAVRTTWPFRNLIEAPTMRTLPIDSAEVRAPASLPTTVPAQR